VPVTFLLIASVTSVTFQSTATTKFNSEVSGDKVRDEGHSSQEKFPYRIYKESQS